MSKGKIIGIVIVLATISTLILNSMGIFGIPPLWDLWKDWFNKNPETLEQSPFDVIIEPNFINEGQYDNGVPITLKVTNVYENNITLLRLSDSDVLIDRLNKNEQTQVANQIQWDYGDMYNRNYIFYYSRSGFSGNNQLIIKGILQGCRNCFMGENSPYEFTFTFQYQKGNGQITPYIIKKPFQII